jgi:hypothetical protein
LRKAWIGVISGAVFFAVVGVALALTNNTVDYSSSVKYKGKPSPKKPKDVTYNGILKISTSDGKQPNTAPLTEVFFAKEFKNNGKRFKSCKVSDIDGKSKIPAKCAKAKVGDGTASSLVGSPGGDPNLRQDLTVKAYNGPKGKSILLVVNGGPAVNRVIPGAIKSAASPFRYKVQFRVPKDLQGQLGTQIALTDFNVFIRSKNKAKVKVKVKGHKRTRRVAYLQITKCPKSKLLPVRAIVHFNKDDNTPGGQTVQDDSSMACH